MHSSGKQLCHICYLLLPPARVTCFKHLPHLHASHESHTKNPSHVRGGSSCPRRVICEAPCDSQTVWWQINKIKDLGTPPENNIVVTHSDAKELFLWNVETQPDRVSQKVSMLTGTCFSDGKHSTSSAIWLRQQHPGVYQHTMHHAEICNCTSGRSVCDSGCLWVMRRVSRAHRYHSLI